MTYNRYQDPKNREVQQVELPKDLRGPFVREIMPEGPYKHRGAQLAAVVFHRNGGHSVITVQGAKHHNKPVFGHPTSVCLIARGRFQATFQMALPTQGDQADFDCAVDVNWEVRDFHLVAEKRVVDVEKMLRPSLLARLRVVTRRHGLAGAQAADEAIQSDLAGGRWSSFGAEIGLATEVFVRIDLGRAAIDHNKALAEVRSDATLQTVRDQAAEARVQNNLSAARQLISSGESDQYAHILAQDPSRAADVLGVLQDQAREQRKGALEYLTHLVDQGVVQRHQVEGPVQMLIDYARAIGGAALEGGLAQAPTALPVPPPARTVPGPTPPAAVLYPEDSRPAPAVADAPPRPPKPPTAPIPQTPPAPAAAPTQQDGSRPVGGKVDYTRKSRRPRGNGPSEPGTGGTRGHSG